MSKPSLRDIMSIADDVVQLQNVITREDIRTPPSALALSRPAKDLAQLGQAVVREFDTRFKSTGAFPGSQERLQWDDDKARAVLERLRNIAPTLSNIAEADKSGRIGFASTGGRATAQVLLTSIEGMVQAEQRERERNPGPYRDAPFRGMAFTLLEKSPEMAKA